MGGRLSAVLEWLDARPRLAVGLGFTLAALLGLADYATGYEWGFTVFFLLPVSLATWVAGRRWGGAMALACATAWILADLAAGHPYSRAIIPYWNAVVRLGSFLAFAYTLAALRDALERARRLARTDSLTGVSNTLHFREVVEREVNRMRRRPAPFAVGYIAVRGAHQWGGQGQVPPEALLTSVSNAIRAMLLAAVAAVLRRSARVVDHVAHLGADEFALLMPDTDAAGAGRLLHRVRVALTDEMRQHDWPVDFAIGAVVFVQPPDSVEEVLRRAEEVVYQVQRGRLEAVEVRVAGL